MAKAIVAERARWRLGDCWAAFSMSQQEIMNWFSKLLYSGPIVARDPGRGNKPVLIFRGDL